MDLYLYISIYWETQDAKGLEALYGSYHITPMWPKLTPEYFASRNFYISETSPTRESNNGSLAW